jgi:hypothetical protein
VALGVAVGLDPQGFGECVGAGRYLPWTDYVTEQAVRRQVTGTPTVLVDGAQVRPTAQEITAAVATVADRHRV